MNEELNKLASAIIEALQFVQDCIAGKNGTQSAFEAMQVYIALSNQRIAVLEASKP